MPDQIITQWGGVRYNRSRIRDRHHNQGNHRVGCMRKRTHTTSDGGRARGALDISRSAVVGVGNSGTELVMAVEKRGTLIETECADVWDPSLFAVEVTAWRATWGELYLWAAISGR